jgi:hypothetical protein
MTNDILNFKLKKFDDSELYNMRISLNDDSHLHPFLNGHFTPNELIKLGDWLIYCAINGVEDDE